MFTVVTQNAERLRPFSQLDHPSTFRYFKTRVLEDAIKTHTYTVLYTDNNCDVGYGHIDKEGDRHYIGLCVMPSHQGKGIGKKILEMLLKESITDLYLTVDDENTRAISLYKKYGFVHVQGKLYFRKKPLMLEVSVGEGLDKLTILDIKLDKIKNSEKRFACQKEYDAIYPVLKPALDKCKFLYNCLKYINLQIWNLQDDVRDNKKEIPDMLNIILNLNDMRFRVKSRINKAMSSSLHEQKGYAERVGLFVSHLGMGDLITTNGAMRYAALQVDKLYVVCLRKYKHNLQQLIGDDSSIEIIDFEDVNDVFFILSIPAIHNQTITHRFLSGNWLDPYRNVGEMIPDLFYIDCGMPTNVRTEFFHYEKPADELPVPDIPYVFTHGHSSTHDKLDFTKRVDIDSVLVIDPEHNYYTSDHKWYNVAQSYVHKPIMTYGSVIENASELYLIDSCFFCLAWHLNLKATKKEVYDRDGNISTRFSLQSCS